MLLGATFSHFPPGAGSLWAQTEVAGYVAAEGRIYPQAPLRDLQPRWLSASAKLQPEITVFLSDRLTLRTIATVRVDQSDPKRSYGDLREALVQWDRDAVAVSLGFNTVFWGVTESRHLVDIINQTDYLDDLDGDEKLGQPMLLVTYYGGDFGVLELFAMTWARPQRYPGPRGRPGVPFPLLDDSAAFESRHGRWEAELAARWSLGIGEVDWALSYFQGTARDPQLLPAGSSETPSLRPSYNLIRQAGVELQWTRGGWLWKAESIVRSGQGSTFLAATGGLEHTSSAVLGTALDLGTIIEYSHDGRDNLTYNIYDSDVFGGFRLSFNDPEGTEVLAGALRDVESGATLGSLEISRRLADGWQAELLARVFKADSAEDPVFWFRRDDFVQFVLEYHF